MAAQQSRKQERGSDHTFHLLNNGNRIDVWTIKISPAPTSNTVSVWRLTELSLFQKCFKHISGRTKNDSNLYEKLYEVRAFGKGYINTLEKIHSKCTEGQVNCLLLCFYESYQQIELFLPKKRNQATERRLRSREKAIQSQHQFKLCSLPDAFSYQ